MELAQNKLKKKTQFEKWNCIARRLKNEMVRERDSKTKKQKDSKKTNSQIKKGCKKKLIL